MNDIELRIEKMKNIKNKFQVLSVYLGEKEKKSPSSKYFRTEFKSLIKKSLNEKEKKNFAKDIEKIQKYFNEFYGGRDMRSIVFFTSGKNLWEVFEFEFPINDYCVVSKSPFLSPMIKAIKKHEKYLVLLVDHKKARLFTVHLGRIEEHEDVFGEQVPQRVRQINEAWMRQDKIFRHIEDHLHRHIHFIAQKTNEFVKNKHIGFLIIGGHEELFSKIEKHLPYPLSKKFIGRFVTELNIPLNDIYLKSKTIAEKAQKFYP
ncbi:MAG: hypothetical protein A3H79_03805 [Candidatus Levybacteria bacterium RIFCSPLOWO2_02_FULL_36_8b]|nr:MAG: hypothetical protein A3H79_03805 [Candidatus Levybacteria bacterium RIFCSPLOWO2_02_FULL_36_8b]